MPFYHQSLTKLHGEPNYDGINCFRNQIKENLTRFTSDLGKRNNGHLSLDLMVVQYNPISNTPYIRTSHPGVLATVRATHHETVTLRDN